MPITHEGTFPVSALNIGVGAATAGLQAEVAELSASLEGMGAGVDAQATLAADFPPNIPGLAAAFTASLNVAELVSVLNPVNWLEAATDVNVDLVARLGLIDAQLTIVEPIVIDLTLGTQASNLTGWSYSGRAEGFGRQLQAATEGGFSNAAPNTNVDALIIATNAFASWQSFSLGFNVGKSADADIGPTTDLEQLQYLGTLAGDAWNIGVRALLPRIRLILNALQAAKLALETQISLSLGVNLPDPGPIVEAGLEVDLIASLGTLEIQLDLQASLNAIQVNIDATLALVAEIEALLAAGGLTFWSYSGPASQLGTSLVSELSDGLPGTPDGPRAPIYGVCVASSNSAAWSAFGSIFRT